MNLAELDQYAAKPFPSDYPADRRRFYAGVDDVHGVIMHALGWVTTSFEQGMYGFDDDEAADKIHGFAADPHCHVCMVLDLSQSGGRHERLILEKERYPNSLVAIGNSRHGKIMHLKQCVINGRIIISGSTNWSADGEGKQENELIVLDNRAEAAQVSAQIRAIYAHMTQAAARAA